ncbi:response regulator [Sporolactobacillus kofuensis]|uniref:Response regulator n=1 Tax=Sporolactobacillus kofuensis TaxID=269672 RepID=A0ABW1WBC2_9BACL|nr:response regulator [Sporolactobacillus kofuensis]MCO7174875.1 response regulator [Sporolactobacillus kofuensis]
MNVLIVDDEYLELEQLSQLIYSRYPHWHLIMAEDRKDALKIAEENAIGLALIDIHLRGESGLDLAEHLKTIHKHVKIIIVTAYQNFDYAKRAIKLNVMDYIVKPIIQEELYELLDLYEEQINSHSVTPSLRKALNYLHKHYDHNVHLQDVADFIHVSPNYLSKKFNDELHLSYNDYLSKIRINKAKQLMTNHPEYSFQYISDMVGFSSQNYFTNSFKKHENKTPTQYKNEQFEAQDE